MYDGLSRISVCVLDEGGLLQVRGDDGHYSGLLPRLPSSLSIGDSVYVQLTAPRGDGEIETVDVLGTVDLLEGGPGPVGLRDGLIFEVDVSHVSRRAGADGAPQPVELAAGADEVPEEPLESPIHFVVGGRPESEAPLRAVDVERREVSYDPAQVYQAVPLSTPDGAAIEDDDDDELDEEKLRVAAEERARARRERFEEEAERPVSPPYTSGYDDEDDEDMVHASDAESGYGDEDETVHQRSGSRRSARAVYEATEPSGVVGTLREMPLTEVVQSLGFSGKTAEIDVRPKGTDLPAGVVFLERGTVVYARCGTLEGEDAFFALAGLKRGAFLIRFHAKAPTTNVTSPTAFLLLEALRRTDEENHERDLVEAVAEEAAADLDAATSDGNDDEDAADRTVRSGTLSLDQADDEEEDPGATEPFARIPSRPLPAPVSVDGPPLAADADPDVADALFGATVADDDEDEEAYADDDEVELDDAAMEEALVAVEAADAADAEDDEEGAGEPLPEPRRPYATAQPTTIFSRFFEEASEDGEPPRIEEGEAEDISDPDFSGLKAALQGLKGGEDDTLAVFDRPLRSGSFPSYS